MFWVIIVQLCDELRFNTHYHDKQKATYRSIAQKLNESGFKTSRGNPFFGNSIKQLEKMFEKA